MDSKNNFLFTIYKLILKIDSKIIASFTFSKKSQMIGSKNGFPITTSRLNHTKDSNNHKHITAPKEILLTDSKFSTPYYLFNKQINSFLTDPDASAIHGVIDFAACFLQARNCFV